MQIVQLTYIYHFVQNYILIDYMMTKIKICYILATPVSLAALATAADTSFPTRGSNASGNTNSVVNSSSFIIFAIAYAAATFFVWEYFWSWVCHSEYD